MKIRYYGFLGNRNRKDNVHLCRDLPGVAIVESTGKNTLELIEEVTGIDITQCLQFRKGQMQAISRILSYVERIKYSDTS
jgi:hypothetical protein